MSDIKAADLNYASKLLLVSYEGEDRSTIDNRIRGKIEQSGFGAKLQTQGWIQTFESELKKEDNDRLSWLRICLVWFLAMWASMISFAGYTGGDLTGVERYYLSVVVSIFGIPAIIIGIVPYAISGLRALRHGRTLTLDLFIFFGGISAIIVSLLSLTTLRPITYADSGSMIVAILLLTKKIENAVVQRITSSILFQIQPSGGKVDLFKKDCWQKAETSQIRKNDRIRLVTGETIVFDGTLDSREAFLDNHLLNGESTKILLHRGDDILAGAIAKSSFEMSVVNPQGYRKIDAWAETALLAQNRNSKYSRFFARIESGLGVFAFSAAIFLAFIHWFQGETLFSIVEAFFVGVLIFCPCLFASIVPLTRQMTHLALSRIGVNMSRSEALLELCTVKNIFIDKTGTLEAVESRFEPILNSDPKVESYVLELASKCAHPILRGLGTSDGSQILSDIIEFPGQGVKAVTDDHSILIVGSPQFIANQGIPLGSSISPHFPIVALNGNVMGQIITKSIYDARALDFLERLTALYPKAGVSILSGDPNPSAGNTFLINDMIRYYGNLDPEAKAIMLQDQSLFIGDGLNDTLVLAKADVSFRVGSRALGFAPVDFQLQSPDIRLILRIIHYAKSYKNILIQTAAAALIYNIIALTLAAFGRFSPLGAVMAMLISFCTLLLSSLRLLRIPKEII